MPKLDSGLSLLTVIWHAMHLVGTAYCLCPHDALRLWPYRHALCQPTSSTSTFEFGGIHADKAGLQALICVKQILHCAAIVSMCYKRKLSQGHHWNSAYVASQRAGCVLYTPRRYVLAHVKHRCIHLVILVMETRNCSVWCRYCSTDLYIVQQIQL